MSPRMSDEEYNAACNRVHEQGKSKYSDRFESAIDGIRKAAAPHGGVNRDALEAIVQRPDAADELMRAGREAVLSLSTDDPDMEQAYRKIRQAEREEHRKLK